MKTLTLLFAFALCIAKAQQPNYTALQQLVVSAHPEIDFSNKLLAVCVWQSDSKQSREQNKEFARTYQTYRQAKLKGGLKGVVFISISTDENTTSFNIAKQKDGIASSVTLCDFKAYNANSILNKTNFDKATTNFVFDTNGNPIHQNLSTDAVFKSFNSLITR